MEWGDFVSAPYCGKVMAELGADVIKVEAPPKGDRARDHGPFPDQVWHPEKSGLFLFNNLGKRGVTLDVGTDSGREVLDRLLASADIFLENQPVRLAEEVGLDFPTVHSKHPSLVVTSISPYGRSGPYRDYAGYDLNVNAIGGMSFGTGYAHREPLTTPMYQVSYLAGVGAAFASTVALLARDLDARDKNAGDLGNSGGQLVDVAEAQILATLLSGYHLPAYVHRGVAGWRSGNRMRLGLFPNCVLPCKDGYVCIDAPQMEQYRRFLSMIGDPDWVNQPRYRDRRAMSDQYPEEAESLITPWFMDHMKEEILKLCLENRVPCVPVREFDEVMADEQLNSRDYFHNVDHPAAGILRYPGAPFRLSATPCRVVRPAPSLGQHNEEILGEELGISQSELWSLSQNGVI